MTDSPKRQLAAVLAADVADYSRLMGEDSDRTLADLRRLRAELFAPMVAGHRGTVVKNMGDGWIVTFASAMDAVTCAMRLQDKMVLEPGIELRMGQHLGDITREDEDVFGEGVNVAARLEALCAPGGVTISDAVFATLDGTLRPAFDDAGERALKNIAHPVRVWTRGGVTGASAVAGNAAAGFPLLQIVPVSFSDARSDVRELANGLTHDLQTYLSQTRWLRAEVATDPEPNAFVLTPVLRTSDDRLRLEARLTAPDGVLLWHGKTDGTLSDVFDWQDETGGTVASQTFAALIDWVSGDLAKKPEEFLTAEEWIVKALAGAKSNVETLPHLLDCTMRAIQLDPDLSIAYEVGVAFIATLKSIGYKEIAQKYDPFMEDWMEKAKALTTGSASSRGILTLASFIQSGDVAATRAELMRLLRDLPFDMETLVMVGFLFNYLGEPDNALECFRRCDAIALHHPNICVARAGTGTSYIMLGRFEAALAEAEESIRLVPSYVTGYRTKMAALAQLGQIEKARQALAVHDSYISGVTVSDLRNINHYVDSPATRRYLDGLRMAGMPD